MDINGIGCSIELYFGSDILVKNSEFVPVQIKEHNGKMHGTISRKGELQKAFMNKCKMALSGENSIDNADWVGMSTIWESIFEIVSKQSGLI